jgi:hypothetical protein
MKELRPPSACRSEIRILLVFDRWRAAGGQEAFAAVTAMLDEPAAGGWPTRPSAESGNPAGRAIRRPVRLVPSSHNHHRAQRAIGRHPSCPTCLEITARSPARGGLLSGRAVDLKGAFGNAMHVRRRTGDEPKLQARGRFPRRGRPREPCCHDAPVRSCSSAIRNLRCPGKSPQKPEARARQHPRVPGVEEISPVRPAAAVGRPSRPDAPATTTTITGALASQGRAAHQ